MSQSSAVQSPARMTNLVASNGRPSCAMPVSIVALEVVPGAANGKATAT
jgi:hypothetical protein